MCVCKKINLNVQTSFENANYHFTDKFSKKLFAKLFMDGVGVTFTELDFCKNGKNLPLQKHEWFASQELLL